MSMAEVLRQAGNHFARCACVIGNIVLGIRLYFV